MLYVLRRNFKSDRHEWGALSNQPVALKARACGKCDCVFRVTRNSKCLFVNFPTACCGSQYLASVFCSGCLKTYCCAGAHEEQYINLGVISCMSKQNEVSLVQQKRTNIHTCMPLVETAMAACALGKSLNMTAVSMSMLSIHVNSCQAHVRRNHTVR